ncbi:hypothetical protein [Actinocorallia populi]|uniref:hypothetical protein n=1 Tax=Actinocorallia populi TaxID=2079200 RepID=UPI000D08F00E|nr:hypothetical protein [Actinocorallia populi]
MADRRREEAGDAERRTSGEKPDARRAPAEGKTARRPTATPPDDTTDLDDGRRRAHNPEDFSPDDFE